MTTFPRPWRDRAGELSALRIAVLCALCLPAATMVADLATGSLGARPFEALQDRTGWWAAWILMASLAVTPLRRAWHWPAIVPLRRMIGVAAFAYAAAHVIGYAADWGFDLVHVAGEVAKRLYLTVGFAGVLILSTLAATSTDGMIRRLGGVRWRALHRLAYAAGAIAVTHYVLQARLDVSGPMTMAGVFLWAMAARGVQRLDPDGRPGPAVWFALALLAAAVAGAGEVGFLSGIKSLPASRVLAANLSIDAGLRPAQMVLIAGLSVALGAALRSAGPLARRRSRVRPACDHPCGPKRQRVGEVPDPLS
jgi:methionine sulfoxide reductase heme-binding subunit